MKEKKRMAGNNDSGGGDNKKFREQKPDLKGKIETSPKVYRTNEKPLSLSQTTFMAPKKIKNMNAGRELSKLREIIEKNNQLKKGE